MAYLGDASIGAKVNVGAGTITCNYDGVNKHRTIVGEGAFLGSNSTLVVKFDEDDRAVHPLVVDTFRSRAANPSEIRSIDVLGYF